MSHFSVLVVTDERPDHDALARILQPWHEFECTGVDDEYIVDIDKTEEALAEFAKAKVVRLRAPDGTLHDRFNEAGEWKPEFSKAKDGYGREEFVPPGYERVELPAKDHEDAAEWISGWYGWTIAGKGDADKLKYGRIELNADGSVKACIDRTNPNKKWDWWSLGGRYSGRLRPKAGREESAAVGQRSWTNENDAIVGVDSCQVCDLDLEAMQAQRSKERQEWVDEIVTKSALSRGDVDRAIQADPLFHAEWLTLPEPRPRGGAYGDWLRAKGDLGTVCATARNAVFELPKVGSLSVTDWIAAAPAITSFAVVKDGNWYENGKMGWWACVSDEDPNWDQRFIELFASLRPDQFVSIVDCHI